MGADLLNVAISSKEHKDVFKLTVDWSKVVAEGEVFKPFSLTSAKEPEEGLSIWDLGLEESARSTDSWVGRSLKERKRFRVFGLNNIKSSFFTFICRNIWFFSGFFFHNGGFFYSFFVFIFYISMLCRFWWKIIFRFFIIL